MYRFIGMVAAGVLVAGNAGCADVRQRYAEHTRNNPDSYAPAYVPAPVYVPVYIPQPAFIPANPHCITLYAANGTPALQCN